MVGEPGAKRATAYKGVSGGLAHRFRPQRLEITHFVTISVDVFCCFSCISTLIYPTQNRLFSQQVPLACLVVVVAGFLPIIMMFTVHIKVFCSILVRLNTKQLDGPIP